MELTRQSLMDLMETERHKRGWSKREMAKQAGVKYGAIQDFYRERAHMLGGINLQKVLSIFKGSSKIKVLASGKIHSGGVTLYKDIPGFMEIAAQQSYIPPGVEISDTLTWFTVEDNSHAPVLFKGYEVWIDEFTNGVCTDLNSNVPHYVKTLSGIKMLCIVRRGYTPGKYNLMNLSRTETIEDIQIESCARVQSIRPR